MLNDIRSLSLENVCVAPQQEPVTSVRGCYASDRELHLPLNSAARRPAVAGMACSYKNCCLLLEPSFWAMRTDKQLKCCR